MFRQIIGITFEAAQRGNESAYLFVFNLAQAPPDGDIVDAARILSEIIENERAQIACECLNGNLVDNVEHCVICLDEKDGSAVQLKCGHAFHYQCLSTWIKTSATCPLCRASVC